MGQLRHRVKHDLSLEERLTIEAEELRARAGNMPHGVEREALIRRARQREAAAHMTDWLTSPGLQSPT
ncbi:hypothetical protein HAP48_0035350 [Bradyrhizobium septentrionale]|nr:MULTISPECIES: hypothetical protein [Bradyrhizobium]UGY13812.1 hypothetical protein HAP48_0035350 [Bradyrhizobium septentrionale]UGY22363.1 hypothetical protein HU675_0030840 [Bradyrhizobium septentrionale]